MAKQYKRKKKKLRKINMLGISTLFFLFSILAKIACSLYINNKTITLSMHIQEMKEEIAVLKAENMQLDNDISYLKSPDRVFEIASSAGMTRPH